MRGKSETPRAKAADRRADATAEPWAPKGMQNSPGSRKPSKREALPVRDMEPRKTANRAGARMGEKEGTSLSPQRGKHPDQVPTTRARRERGNPNAAQSVRSQKGRDPEV